MKNAREFHPFFFYHFVFVLCPFFNRSHRKERERERQKHEIRTRAREETREREREREQGGGGPRGGKINTRRRRREDFEKIERVELARDLEKKSDVEKAIDAYRGVIFLSPREDDDDGGGERKKPRRRMATRRRKSGTGHRRGVHLYAKKKDARVD